MPKRVDYDAVRATFAATKKWRPEGNIAETARLHGIAYPTAKRICGEDATSGSNSRFKHAALGERPAQLPAIDSPFLTTKRTRYPGTVKRADELAGWALKDGHNSAKIGQRVAKGAWAGMRIFTLTLEERATCPVSCRHWRSCYGNQMHFAERVEAGRPLEEKLWAEVHELGRRFPGGFVVRLHVLGDFYSPFYVAMWGALLDAVPALRVFGYTARIDGINDPTSFALVNLVRANWERFAIRFSNAPIDECSTVSIEHPLQAPAEAIVCPQQTGRTVSCATCALCWSTRRPIAFLQH